MQTCVSRHRLQHRQNLTMTILITSGQIVVSDPRHDAPTEKNAAMTDFLQSVVDVRNGEYEFYSSYEMLVIFHKDCMKEAIKDVASIDNVIVDSGFLGMYDKRFFETESCSPVSDLSVQPHSVTSRVDFGDGTYNVSVGRINNEVVMVEVMFVDDATN